DESGKFEIYVQPFPGLGQKWQVSTGGGEVPRWRRDGKEIFFLKFPEKTLMAAEVKAGSTFSVGEPKALFQTQIRRSDFGTQYDVSPDGSRFLINTLVDDGMMEALTVVQNWTVGLKNQMAAGGGCGTKWPAIAANTTTDPPGLNSARYP